MASEDAMDTPAVGTPAPDAVFLDADGRAVHLSDFWRTQPIVLMFLRHFG